MHSPTFPHASQIDWHDYVGLTVFSADNQRLGVVERIVQDSISGATLLRITRTNRDEARFYIPASAVGVIARDRVMLDSYQNRVAEIIWEPPVWDELPAEG